MAAAFVIPYMVPLFLGMTYDARFSRPGVDIYDKEFVDKPLVTSFMQTETNYKVVSSMSDVLKTLSISGDLSLKIKTGMIDVEGKGSYLKNEKDYKNSVLVLTTLKYTSVVKAFNANAKPRQGWAKQYSTEALGTHFVSSITYGAELIASAKFVVYNTSDVTSVKGDVRAALGTGGTGAELVADGKLDLLQKKLKGRANLEISYYGTVPLKKIPNNVAGLTELINTFAEQVKESGLEDGIPMSAQVDSLTVIADAEDRHRFEYQTDNNLEADLSEFAENMDELRQARLDLTTYARTLPYQLDTKLEKKVGELVQNMTDILQIHYNVLWTLDLTKGPEQLKPALEAYDYDDSMQSRKFDRLVRKIQLEIEKQVDRNSDVASSTYIHYGRNECNGNDTVLLYDGFIFSSAEEGIGGASQYSCVSKAAEKGYDLDSKSKVSSFLAGIRYAELDKASNPFKGAYADKVSKQGVTCAKCYSPSSASIAMFSASSECPFTWDLLYGGYLMSSRTKDGHTTEYICVDDTPSMPYKMDDLKSNRNIITLTTIHSEGSLPEETYIQGALVKCVVCAMRNNEITI